MTESDKLTARMASTILAGLLANPYNEKLELGPEALAKGAVNAAELILIEIYQRNKNDNKQSPLDNLPPLARHNNP